MTKEEWYWWKEENNRICSECRKAIGYKGNCKECCVGKNQRKWKKGWAWYRQQELINQKRRK